MMRRNKKEEKENLNTQPADAAQKEQTASGAQQNPATADTAEARDSEGSGPDPSAKTGPDPALQLAEMTDKYLRLYSDFDNFRKRTLKEKAEWSKTASGEVITKLLPVLDDFDRAIRAFGSTEQATTPLTDGIVLIYNKLTNILQQQGLQVMRSDGEVFDTDFHEAVTNIPAPAPELKGRIVDVIEKGYLFNGKVIRYAKVVVGN